jgi:hypothetical protein
VEAAIPIIRDRAAVLMTPITFMSVILRCC